MPDGLHFKRRSSLFPVQQLENREIHVVTGLRKFQHDLHVAETILLNKAHCFGCMLEVPRFIRILSRCVAVHQIEICNCALN